ncbi:FAD/NAD(P)-binding domain-containing protein [Mollisia scopiformis]|uniref:FAD/NAD(P)-binding domain-containing protein n=1 Tax=Mollisia scopiformis TaxID=149040 RepID=A0A194XRJ6_MOLSC|nr:FAD/NAD(P)-binding domain-containing protein [Mollisia scopiformis]KUJ22674.1 FAD/NAD(P)-binding domain-containing protein [Mollisia scopiformis]
MLRLALRTLTTTKMTPLKTVAIIGAGPSGLIAAAKLAPTHHVTLFEKSPRIGGLWPLSPDQNEGGVSPEMQTNQSRHTVAFSDFSWGEGKSEFPRAWEVGGYLKAYGERYLGEGTDVRFGAEVSRVSKRGEKWGVVVKGERSEEEREFDFLVVGTGFFGREKIPDALKGEKISVPVWHSSKVRDVKDFLTDGGKRDLKGVKGRNIVVVGGQMSGVETAAAVALQISSLTNSPGDEAEAREWGAWTVTHVVGKPVWVMPLFFPRDPVGEDGEGVKKNNSSPEFLPLDLVNYNLGWRPPGPIQNTSGHISVEGAQMVHGFMNTYIGTDQTEYGVPVLNMTGNAVRNEPPMLACSDYYTEFVRAGKIKVVEGRMKSISSEGTSMEVESSSGKVEEISEIAAVISATGFDASSSLSFLPEELLQQLQFDPNDDGFPLALNVHTVVNRSIPSLGFVGFYRSPYWGVMEMQARYLAKLWSGDAKAQQALADDKTMDTMLKLRNNPRRAQFPMGDYAYLMESFAEILDIKRTEPENSTGRSGIVLPPRYLPSTTSPAQVQEAENELSIIDRIFTASSTAGKFVARATFRALQGTWHLDRTISSQLPTFPSGTLSGTASFLPRFPTSKEADMEYLYFEEGDFRPSWGGTMTAKRSYIYHYQEKSDAMDVWFAKGDGKTSDYFFHRLEFLVEGRERELGEPWRARSSHLCIEDLYNVEYEFYFRGTVVERWTSRYNVKGPKKDYVIENLYTRPVRAVGM